MGEAFFQTIQYRKIVQSIEHIIVENGYDAEISDTIINLFDYMIEKNLRGACHALTAILYVAFKEMDYEPIMKIGECRYKNLLPFDHSWIELDRKVIDLAIFMPLQDRNGSHGGPNIFGRDALTNIRAMVEYGINTGLEFSEQTISAIKAPLTEYMNGYPYESGGLWSVLEKIYVYENELDIAKLKLKYAATKRVLVR